MTGTMNAGAPRTLYDKIFDAHVVERAEDGTCVLYIDRHLVHEVTSPQAFEGLREAGRKVWRIAANLAVSDHNVPTTPDRVNGIENPEGRIQVAELDKNARDFGLNYYPMNDIRQGIVHIVGPEQGWTLPGMTVVCGDSHTATHGAFGASSGTRTRGARRSCYAHPRTNCRQHGSRSKKQGLPRWPTPTTASRAPRRCTRRRPSPDFCGGAARSRCARSSTASSTTHTPSCVRRRRTLRTHIRSRCRCLRRATTLRACSRHCLCRGASWHPRTWLGPSTQRPCTPQPR